MRLVKTHLIYFEVAGQGYAVPAADLSGVGTNCPFTTYPSLPEGVSGILQWSGKIYPVVSMSVAGQEVAIAKTFLFSGEGILTAPFSEIALAVPGKVRVFFPESTQPLPEKLESFITAVVTDSEGVRAMQISLTKLVEIRLGRSKVSENAA